MTLPSLYEIQEAVRSGRLKRLSEPRLEEYLESLTVSGVNATDPTFTQGKDAVRDELERRAGQGRSRWNAICGVIGALGAIGALVAFKGCH
jgi:hypothetical protein